ncbi:MAG: hypothetical protein ACK44W_04605 [Planctomycetota bacterium]
MALFSAVLAAALAVQNPVEVVAGGGTLSGDGPATKVRLQEPFAVDFDAAGMMYIAEMSGHRIRRVDPSGRLTTVAGDGVQGDAGDGGPAARARFNGIHHIAFGPDGLLYVADTWNHRVRRLDVKAGTIHPFAGTGEKGFSGDLGPAARARFGAVYSLAFDPRGNRLYVADLDNRRIRAVDLKTGQVSTVAGNGQKGVPEDGGEAAAQPLVDPRAVAADRKGNLYIVERGGHALRVVDPAGRIRTVAWTGRKGFSGDGGPAREAELNGPKHLAVDAEDNVLIADTENHVIRKVLVREGRIVRVAGTGRRGTGGVGGPPAELEMARPHGVYVHPSGALYVSDSDNHRVLRIGR